MSSASVSMSSSKPLEYEPPPAPAGLADRSSAKPRPPPPPSPGTPAPWREARRTRSKDTTCTGCLLRPLLDEAAATTATLSRYSCALAGVEANEVESHYLYGLTGLAILPFPLAGLQPAFDVDFAAFAKVLVAGLG